MRRQLALLAHFASAVISDLESGTRTGADIYRLF